MSRRTQTLNARQKPISYGYDGLGRTIAITDALLHVTRYQYDGYGNRTQIVNPKSEIVNFQYDGLDRLIKTIDPESNETSYSYDKGGNRLTMTDAETVTTRYGYDNLSRLIQVTENYIEAGPIDHQTNLSTHYGYDRVGNRTVITNAQGYTSSYIYDALNRRIEQTNAEGYTTRYGYDQLGNRTIMTDANTIAGQGGAITTFYYDRVNRLTEIDYSDSISDVQISYDAAGNRKTMIDGSGQSDYDYDELYRLSDITDGADQRVGYRYDAAGNRTLLIYPNNQVVTYTYDAANRLDTVTDWQEGQFAYNYDDANRLDSLTMPHNLSSDYIYDEAGRLTQLSHTTASNTIATYSYALDKVGNRRTLTETVVTNVDTPQGSYLEQDGLVVLEAERYGDYVSGTSHSWVFTSTLEGYHHPGYLHATPDLDALYQTQSLTDSPTLDYLIHFTTPGTYTLWARAYADNGDADSLHLALDQQPLRLSGFSPEAWSWSNQAMSQPTYPLTVTIESRGLHTLTVWMREDGLRLDRILLTTDTTFIPTDLGPDPTVRQRTETVIQYDYDPLYRLTNADYSTGETYAYNYDPVGNRLQQIIDGDITSYLYDDANRLQSVDGQPYTFDANGNLLNSDTMTNTWDAANRLTKIVNPKSEIANRYNGVNDRVGQTIGLSTTHFALDVAAGLPEVIYTSENEAYLHLPGVIVTEKAGETRYLLSDGLGSVRQAMDDNGSVVVYNEFDPYGNPIVNRKSSIVNPYGYTGEWWQDEVELLHLRARWYMPETGTFLSRDPWEGDIHESQTLNHWPYVQNNPVNFSDPSGYIKKSEDKTAKEILEGLQNTYQVTVVKDWGERNVFINPGTLDTACVWQEGEWSLDEMKNSLFRGVNDLARAMGGSDRFIANIGGLRVVQEDLGGPLGLTKAHSMRLTNRTKSFGNWTIVHELGHAWDANFDHHLSQGLEKYTGGHTSSTGATGCDKDNRFPGCNNAKYFYGGIPPAGSGSGFTRGEDFAESVTAYVYPARAQAKVQKYEEDPLYKDILYYADYTETLRWQYIDGLLQHTIE